MSTRHVSGYARQPADLYQTPAWVVDTLAEHFPLAYRSVWEPACGEGQIVLALETHLASVFPSDLNDHGFKKAHIGIDFLTTNKLVCDGIITNPPYGQGGRMAVAFIRHGLRLIEKRGFMCLLLPGTFDNAITRADLFENCPLFAAKITVRKRIMWFPGDAQPKENHAWFIWESTAFQCGPARILYGPKIAADVA